jgi:hypothetical protein
MTKTELKQTIKEVIQEELKGYSQYTPGGVTKGGTTDDFRQILTKIAKGPENYEGDPERGNKILDKANPDNVARILRGEKPVYEGEGKLEKYTVFFYKGDDDYDWDVMATSEEDAIKKVQSGEVKGPYGQELPRLARKFSAKKV